MHGYLIITVGNISHLWDASNSWKTHFFLGLVQWKTVVEIEVLGLEQGLLFYQKWKQDWEKTNTFFCKTVCICAFFNSNGLWCRSLEGFVGRKSGGYLSKHWLCMFLKNFFHFFIYWNENWASKFQCLFFARKNGRPLKKKKITKPHSQFFSVCEVFSCCRRRAFAYFARILFFW